MTNNYLAPGSTVSYNGLTYTFVAQDFSWKFPYEFAPPAGASDSRHIYCTPVSFTQGMRYATGSFSSDGSNSFGPISTAYVYAAYGMATIKEAAYLGGQLVNNNMCILKSQLSTYGCSFYNNTGLNPGNNQLVAYADLSRISNKCHVRYHKDDSTIYNFYEDPNSPYNCSNPSSGTVVRATILDCMFTKDMYEFQGWKLNDDTSIIYDPGDTVQMPNSQYPKDFDFYAQWELVQTKVVFNMNGHGTSIPDITGLNVGDKITKPTDPTATGYKFVGWYKDNGTFLEPWNFEIDTVHWGVNNLYALWGNNSYRLTVLANPSSDYGTTTGSGTYAYNTQVTITATPHTGYSFYQWANDGSTNTSKTVTVTQDVTWNAIFSRNATGDIRIVDSDLKLYTYDMWDSLAIKPTPIGVAIDDGEEWIVSYKDYIGDSGEGIIGYKMGSVDDKPSGLPVVTAATVLYPHSGLDNANIWKNARPGYAADKASQLTDGDLTWYLPNIYEMSQILLRANDTSGVHNGFNSHFTLIGKETLKITTDSGAGRHGHWSTDVGDGASSSAGTQNPFRACLSPNGKVGYRSSGNYVWASNYNWVKPVARIPANSVKISYNANGGTWASSQASQPTLCYANEVVNVKSATSNISKLGCTFIGWCTTNKPIYLPTGRWVPTVYNCDDSSLPSTISSSSNITLYAIWSNAAKSTK